MTLTDEEKQRLIQKALVDGPWKPAPRRTELPKMDPPEPGRRSEDYLHITMTHSRAKMAKDRAIEMWEGRREYIRVANLRGDETELWMFECPQSGYGLGMAWGPDAQEIARRHASHPRRDKDKEGFWSVCLSRWLDKDIPLASKVDYIKLYRYLAALSETPK